MLGQKIYKENLDSRLYTKMAIWASENNATIEDMGDYYEVVALPVLSLHEQAKDLWMDKTDFLFLVEYLTSGLVEPLRVTYEMIEEFNKSDRILQMSYGSTYVIRRDNPMLDKITETFSEAFVPLLDIMYVQKDDLLADMKAGKVVMYPYELASMVANPEHVLPQNS